MSAICDEGGFVVEPSGKEGASRRASGPGGGFVSNPATRLIAQPEVSVASLFTFCGDVPILGVQAHVARGLCSSILPTASVSLLDYQCS